MLFKGNSSTLQNIIDRLQTNQEHRIQIDTLGTERGSPWASKERNTSPRSSCPTPSSSAGSEFLFTVGATDGTPHKCQFCEKAFVKLSYLKKHEQSHTDYLPFQCMYCERYFKHKRSRDRHIKLHTGDKKYKCDQCDSAFSRSDHLKIHMKTHDTLKPYQCTVCNRGYNTAAALTSHLQNHRKNDENHSPSVQPVNTFKCLRCTQLFRRPEDLRRHMVTDPTCGESRGHRGKSKSSPSPPTPSTSCFLCFKEFPSNRAMAAHMQSAHKSFYNAYHSREKISTVAPTANNNLFGSNGGAIRRRSNRSSFSSGTATTNFYCELCTMHFPTALSHQKHMIDAHSIEFPNRILHFAAAAAAAAATTSTTTTTTRFSLPEALNGGASPAPATTSPYCVLCSLHFPTMAVFAEHCITTHGRGGSYSLSPPSVEQTVPTDLTVARRESSKKRSFSERTGCDSPKKPETMSNEMPNGSDNAMKESEEHYCPQCDGKFIEFESFKAHIKWHLEVKSFGLGLGLLGGSNFVGNDIGVQYRCSVCVVATFPNREELIRHQMTHYVSASVAHLCQQCRTSFDTPNELHTHMTDTHVEKLYCCSICREVFESRSSIDTHFTDKHRNKTEIYRCLGCPNSPAIYYSENEIAEHVNSEHIGAQFMRPEMPSDYTIQEENLKDFSLRRKVNSSSARYESDKMVKKELCNGNSNGAGGEEGQTVSDICDRRNFANEKELQLHMKREHNTKRASPNKISLYCAYCNENCKSHAELALHTKSHSPFAHQSFGKCDICDEMCPNAIALAEHKLTHYKTIFNNDQNLQLQSVNHSLLENRIPSSPFLNANYFYGADLQKQLIPFGHFPLTVVNDSVYGQTLNRFYGYSLSNGTAAGGDNEHCRSSPNAVVAVDTATLNSASTSSESYEDATDLVTVRAAVKTNSSARDRVDYSDQSEDEQIDVVDMKIDEKNEKPDEKS